MTTPDKIYPSGRFVPVDEGTRLYALALSVEEDAVLTYSEVQREIGIDIQHTRRPLWSSVADRLMRDRGYVFRAEPNVGYRRLKDAGKSERAREHVMAAHNRARDALRVASVTKVSELDPQQRVAHDATCAVATVVLQETAPKSLQARDRGQPPPRVLPIEELMRIGAALR